MRRVVNGLGSPHCGKWLFAALSYAALMLCLTTTMALIARGPSYAQTFTTLYSFDCSGTC
jgi:hypothetical protein